MTNRNGVFVSVLVEALHRSGVRHACVTPGSRNTPLSMALAAHPGITDWSHHDERSSAFFALGLARTLGEAVVIVTTSGTAAGELLPALQEADASRVPLIALTADRPTELFGVDAPQTVDQRRIYGSVVRWSHDLDVPDPSDAGPDVTAALAVRLVVEATGTPAGPVHLNVRFREPLSVEPDFAGVEVPTATVGSRQSSEETLNELADRVNGRQGLIVAGPQREPRTAPAAVDLGEALGWPIVSDPISGLRTGHHDTAGVVGSDLLAANGFMTASPPQAVIRIGAPPTSKKLREWLGSSGVAQIVIDPAGWPDPDGGATTLVRADVATTLVGLASRAIGCDPGWRARWIDADRSALASAHDAIAGLGFPTEPGVVAALARSLPAGSALWTASSMPIRDVDSFFPVATRDVVVRGNRGANGIDGFVSSALGSAAAGVPTVAHVGDLSLLHDIGALATMRRLGLPVTVVVVNNDGGGIFHFLPQLGSEHFERHFGTPHGLSFSEIAKGFGIDAIRVDSPGDLDEAIGATGRAPRLVEVVTDRHANREIHRLISRSVRGILGTA